MTSAVTQLVSLNGLKRRNTGKYKGNRRAVSGGKAVYTSVSLARWQQGE